MGEFDFRGAFETIIEKLGNNENISVELNDLMSANATLIAEHEALKTEHATVLDHNNRLKEANNNLLLSKGFVRTDFQAGREEAKEEPFDIKKCLIMK